MSTAGGSPCLCCILHHPTGKRSFPKDILPIYTRDVACIIIQRKWRAILMRQFLRALVRAQFDEVWDPVKGRFNYYHRDGETLYQDKPKLLGMLFCGIVWPDSELCLAWGREGCLTTAPHYTHPRAIYMNDHVPRCTSCRQGAVGPQPRARLEPGPGEIWAVAGWNLL